VSEEFNEEFISKRLDPLAPPDSQDFPWHDVYRDLDGEQEKDTDEPRDKLVHALCEIFRVCLSVDFNNRAPDLIGRRMIAVAARTNPELFFSNPALQALRKRLRIT
jgi:hypothetical protein